MPVNVSHIRHALAEVESLARTPLRGTIGETLGDEFRPGGGLTELNEAARTQRLPVIANADGRAWRDRPERSHTLTPEELLDGSAVTRIVEGGRSDRAERTTGSGRGGVRR